MEYTEDKLSGEFVFHNPHVKGHVALEKALCDSAIHSGCETQESLGSPGLTEETTGPSSAYGL